MDWTRLRRPLGFEALTYLLVFLFPVGGMLFRGWLTNVFNLLFLLGLFFLRKRKLPLRNEEKVFLVVCFVYVGIYFLSGLVNGWHKIQTHELGTEIRFWMAIPVYLLVREQPRSWRWLLYGSLLGILFIFIQSYYEVYTQHRQTAWGVYSKNIIGPFAALMGFWIIFLWREHKQLSWKIIIIIGFVLAVVSTGLSGSRGAYVGLLAMVIGWLLFMVRGRWLVIGAVLMFGLIALIYNKTAIVHDGVERAVNKFQSYIDTPNKAKAHILGDSTAVHLEMWRAAKYFFPDHPLIGVGPGNYQSAARKYASEGKVNPAIAEHGHPHNIFLEALYSKGIIGLISLLLLLYYPFYVFYRDRLKSLVSAGLGMVFIIGITGFSMFDASPILFNNYTSILLLALSIFLSHHLDQIAIAERDDG